MIFRLRLIINSGYISLFFLITTIAHATNLQRSVYPEDMLILKFTMGQKILLAENIIAYPNLSNIEGDVAKSSIVLSLQEFVSALEFPIEVFAEQGKAIGWYVEQQRKFVLDVAQGFVVIKDQKGAIKPQYIQWYEDDLFIDIELLEQWFGVTFSYDSNRQILNLTSKEILPFQKRWARQAQQEKLKAWLANKSAESKAYDGLPLYSPSFDFFSMPNVTTAASVSHSYSSQQNTSTSYRYSGNVNHDLFYQNAQWFFKGSNEQAIESLRFSLSRESESGDLASFGLTRYVLGEDYSYAVPLVSNSVSGLGVNLTTFDLGYRTQDNAVTLRGENTPNWDIEVYRNEALFNAGKVDENGQYEFIDVPLVSGVNEIKLIFYGPRGEKEEKIETYYMHADLAKVGDFNWRVSAFRDNSVLFDFAENKSEIAEGSRLVFHSEYGLTNQVSLITSIVDLPIRQTSQRHRYLSLGSRMAIGNSYVNQQYVYDVLQRKSALQLFMNTQISKLNVNGRYQRFADGYVSEKYQMQEKPLASRLQLNLYQQLQTPAFSHLSVGFKSAISQYSQGEKASEFTFSAALAKDKFSMTNELSYVDGEFDGSAIFNFPSWRHWKVRGTAHYSLHSNFALTGFSLVGDYQLQNDFRFNIEAKQLLEPQPVSQLGLRLYKQFDGYTVDFSAQYQSGGHYYLGLSLAFNFDGFGLQPKSQEKLGNVNARVFLDRNNNDVYDEDDVPLPNVHFSIDGRDGAVITDSRGIAALKTKANRKSIVKISPGVFGDYYWNTHEPEKVVISRIGKPLNIDFAARLNGEIEGMVFDKSRKNLPVSGVLVELLDDKGIVQTTVKSGFDGFYLFEKVPFGRYQLRVEPTQLVRSQYHSSVVQYIEVNESNDIVSGVDFYLSKTQSLISP